MKLPGSLVPILEKITKQRDCGVEFWKSLSGDDLIDMLFDLSGELMLSDIDEGSIPEGYVLLAYIFYWETNCQFSGWYAIENKQDEMEKILSCYRKVGLTEEADALTKAVETWFATNQDHEKVGAAYSTVANRFSDEADRFLYLANYFSDNADRLLYDNQEM